jgi:hypothetical protein
MKLADSTAAIFNPPDRRPIPEWATENVELFPPITRPGKFNCSQERHFLQIFEALEDERTREVNVLKPVRGGGSLIGDIHLASTLGRRPYPYMNVFQTDADAKMHWFDRLEKMLLGCPATARLLPRRYEWSEIYLNSGHTLYTGGPGISNLQSKGVCYVRLDECWLYALGRMTEAEARVGDYLKMDLSKILRISQAGAAEFRTLDDCDWHRAWLNGERNEWEVTCQHCGQYFDPAFSGSRDDGSFWGVTWDHHKTIHGDWIPAKCVPSIRFECPHCRGTSPDTPRTKGEWNRTGRYRVTTEQNVRRRGFHWESVIDFPWEELVVLWLDACNAERRGDLKPKLQFYQKRRALFRDEESLLKGGLHLKRAAYEINSDWKEERARFMAIDRQEEDLLWWEVRAWSTEESRQLGFGKCYGFAAAEELRINYKVVPNHTFCDSGFLPKGDHGVYAACARYGWIAMKGDDDYHFVHHIKRRGIRKTVLRSYSPPSLGDPGSGTHEQGQKYCNLIRFSKLQMNEIVQRLHDSGLWIQPTTVSPEMQKEYSEQFGARVRIRDFDPKTGKTRVWWKEGKNDHGRDLANMQALGAVVSDLVPDPATERLTPSEEKGDG